MSIGVPIKVLHEAEGHIVTCETITGEVYRGKLIEAEDNMNCQMTQITVTYRDGRTANLENVYIRGSKIRFMILPDMLKNAPMFKKQGPKSGTAGRGKSAMIRAQSKFFFLCPFAAECVSKFIYSDLYSVTGQRSRRTTGKRRHSWKGRNVSGKIHRWKRSWRSLTVTFRRF